jgi:hypothetical protein
LVGSKTNDEGIQERYEKAVEKGDVIVLDGSPTTVAMAAMGKKEFRIRSRFDKKRSAYFDPESNKEVYEWNGVWYQWNGDGPVGKRWSREGRTCDWRPTVAEEEEYNAWYVAYFKNVVVRRVLRD